jgi:hypothetical protein
MDKLTPHAEEQIEDRGIPMAWIEATCAAPDRIEPDPIAGRTRLFRSIPEFSGRVLRVVVETKATGGREVVTAHFDRAETKRRNRR